MSDPTVIGSLSIDCTSLASFLVDLPPGGMRGFLSEQPGFSEAIAEILANQPTIGMKAGIQPNEITNLVAQNEKIAEIDAVLPAVEKLLEMLVETRAALDNERQREVYAIAAAVEAKAKGTQGATLRAKYEKTRAYRSAIGIKAAKTRKKKAEATR